MSAAELASTPSAKESVVCAGRLEPEKHLYDAGPPHAVGVHNIRVFRANLEQSVPPAVPERRVSGVRTADPPTSIVTPDDGYAWSPTRVVFPEYQLSEIKRDGVNIPEKMYAVMYQRMGFYVAPHGRLLARGFHVFAENPPQSPNAGDGFGRVVREVRAAPPACWIDDPRTL